MSCVPAGCMLTAALTVAAVVVTAVCESEGLKKLPQR